MNANHIFNINIDTDELGEALEDSISATVDRTINGLDLVTVRNFDEYLGDHISDHIADCVTRDDLSEYVSSDDLSEYVTSDDISDLVRECVEGGDYLEEDAIKELIADQDFLTEDAVKELIRESTDDLVWDVCHSDDVGRIIDTHIAAKIGNLQPVLDALLALKEAISNL